MILKNNDKQNFSFKLLIIGYFILILLGGFLLTLPISTRDSNGASFFDAIFTSTSAVCVTGLVVQDTATYWSIFGQFIILLLIQIGGLGFLTILLMAIMITGKRIGLLGRNTMKVSISAPNFGGVLKITKFIFLTTVCVEFLGAISLSFQFCKEFDFLKGIWYSIFHSVSAFCNAGFDLMGIKSQFSSLTSYIDNTHVIVTFVLLILIGGIGFFTLNDIKTNKFHFKKYSMQSKVVLTVTAFLLIFPFVFFFLFEFSNMPIKSRILASLFQTVTPRTAGFNTFDYSEMSEPGKLVTIILMLIGGSSGSTAGGIKMTTVAVIFASAISAFKQRGETNIFHRSISNSAEKTAIAVFTMYIVLLLTGGIAISVIDALPILTTLFEVGSAIGTVGLSLGITPTLSVASKTILIFLMFFGRVGGMTLMYATVAKTRLGVSKFPQENINVG